MAQIKKFQTPAGPITTAEEKTTPKYGRLIQNGIAIEATDDMIGWLSSQGYYGQQMASNLKNGVDQYVDVDENGVGSIKNIQVENPDLNKRQQNKTTRRRRGLEGYRMSEAREAIDTLAGYDYSKFKAPAKTTTPYSWDELIIDYNPKTEGGKTTYVYSLGADSNRRIEQRLADIEAGLIIPEGQTFADRDTVLANYERVKGNLLTTAVKNMKNGTLTDLDKDVLRNFNIVVAEDSKKEKSETTQSEDVISQLTTNLGITQAQAERILEDFDVDTKGNLVSKKAITDTYGQNYWFGNSDLNGKYTGYALLDGRLYKTSGDYFQNWLNSVQGQEFIDYYNQGNWNYLAQKPNGMRFAGIDSNPWDRYSHSEHYNQYFKNKPNHFIYRDLSPYYDFDTTKYVGLIETLEKQEGSLLYVPKKYYVKGDGTLENYDNALTRSVYPTVGDSSKEQLRVIKWNNGVLDLGNGLKITKDSDGKYIALLNDKKLNTDTIDNTNIYSFVEGVKAMLAKQGRNVTVTDVPQFSRSILKTGGVISKQPGGVFGEKAEQTTETPMYDGPQTDPTKSLTNKDLEIFDWNQLSAHDKAELASIGMDAVSVAASFVPGWGNVAAGVAGLGSTVSNFIANQRDGFQWSDLGYAGLDLALTGSTLIPGAGSAGAISKFVKGLGKAHRILSPIFISLGLVDGVSGLQNIISGDYDMQDVRSVMNGVMAIRGVIGNKKSHKTAKKFAKNNVSETSTPKATKNSVDARLEEIKTKNKSKYEELVRKVVDKALSLHPEWKQHNGITNSWAEGDIKYNEAWKALREDNHLIDDDLIKNTMGWSDRAITRVSGAKNKTKEVVSEKTSEGLEWFKTNIGELMVPVNPENYTRTRSIPKTKLMQASPYERQIINAMHLTAPESRLLPKNKTVKVWSTDSKNLYKNGGKVKKYSGGDDLVSLVKSFDLPISFAEAQKIISPQSKESEFKLNTSDPFFDTKSVIKQIGDEISKPNYESKYVTPKSSPQQIDLGKVGMNHDRLTRDSSGNIVAAKTLSSGSDAVFGGGKKSDLISRIGEGLLNGTMRAAAYLNTEATNKKVLDETINGIGRKYTGAQKSMPVGPVAQRYNLDPLITTFNDQKADVWAQTREFNKSTSDQKLALANNQATATRITKGENALLDRISKQITEVDLANTNARNLHLKDEQTIADYNRQLGGVQAAEEASARAQYEQKKGDNFNKMLAELRSDWNQYTASKDNMDLYNKYSNLFNEYNNPATTVERKAELKDQIGMLSYLIKQGSGVRNPFTYQRSWNI